MHATFAVRVTLPLVALAGLVASVWLVFPGREARFLGLLVAYTLPPAGKETVIPAMIADGVSPFMAATYIGGLDMITAWFLAWNWDLVTRVPGVGGPVDRVMRGGRAWFDRHPTFERSAFAGLAVFVFVPVQGTGAIAGTVVARMFGMPPQRAWVAIMIGALASSFAFAYAADAMRELIARFGWETVLTWTLLVISGVALSVLAYRRTTRA